MLVLLKHRFTPRILSTFVFELIALNFCLFMLVGIRYARWHGWATAFDHVELALVFALTCTFVIQFGLWSFGLYSHRVVYCGRRVYRNLLRAFLTLCVALLPVCLLFSWADADVFGLTTKFYVIVLAGFVGLVAVERGLVLRLFREAGHLGNVLIVGNGQSSRELIRAIQREYGYSLHIVGLLTDKDDQVWQTIQGVPILGTIADTERVVKRENVGTILMSAAYDHPNLPVDFLLQCKLSGVKVLDSCEFYETVGQKILVEKLDPYLLLFSKGYNATRLRWLLKEAGETLIAAVSLAFLAIPFGIVALAIRWTSPGPAIYRQTRVGKGGQPFTLYKFRTMRDDAEAGTGAVWATRDDPRVTKVGKWLRRLRIDELPQLYNVLRGDMALIGPRPERPEFVQELEQRVPFYRYRHLVKPGLTGWAQVAYSYAASMDEAKEKLRYDLYYVKHMGFFFDLMIVLATVKAVVKGRGLS